MNTLIRQQQSQIRIGSIRANDIQRTLLLVSKGQIALCKIVPGLLKSQLLVD